MADQDISDEEFNQAWFNTLLPPRRRTEDTGAQPAPEHERMACLTYNIYIDHIGADGWQARICDSGMDREIWKSHAWRIREYAIHSAMYQVTSGKIMGRGRLVNAD